MVNLGGIKKGTSKYLAINIIIAPVLLLAISHEMYRNDYATDDDPKRRESRVASLQLQHRSATLIGAINLH